MVLDLVAQLDTEQSRRIKVERLLRQLLEARSGRKSEQISDHQLALFAAELKAQGVDMGEAQEESKNPGGPDDAPPGPPVEQEKGKPHGRRSLPVHLKRERIEHDLAEAEKHCAACAQDLRPIGEESSE